MSNNNEIERFIKIQKECLKSFKENKVDYVNRFKEFGSIYLLSNICNNIYQLQIIKPFEIKLFNTNQLRNYLTEIHNFSAMAIIELDKNKPEKPNKPETNYLNFII